jgi:DNA-binding transcriptional MerR regulator
MEYTVAMLSKLAGISVRTLHHYDDIGLLVPARKDENGYRFYGEKELMILQQILFYKAIGFPLKEVRRILQSPEFDILCALENHHHNLTKTISRYENLKKTLEKTIQKLKKNIEMKDSELYEGFNSKETEAIRKEVTERWGKKSLDESENKIKMVGKEKFSEVKKRGEEINQRLANLMSLDPGHARVQEAIKDFHENMNFYYEVTKERLLGLGQMYVEDERFTAHYDMVKPGLAFFINDAIKVYCKK